MTFFRTPTFLHISIIKKKRKKLFLTQKFQLKKSWNPKFFPQFWKSNLITSQLWKFSLPFSFPQNPTLKINFFSPSSLVSTLPLPLNAILYINFLQFVKKREDNDEERLVSDCFNSIHTTPQIQICKTHIVMSKIQESIIDLSMLLLPSTNLDHWALTTVIAHELTERDWGWIVGKLRKD